MAGGKPFERRDAIGQGVKGTLIVGGVGAILSGIQNSLSKQNIGAFGVITRTGGTIGIFGMHPFIMGRDCGTDGYSCYGWFLHVRTKRCCQLEGEGRQLEPHYWRFCGWCDSRNTMYASPGP